MAEQSGRRASRFRFPFWTASAPQRRPSLPLPQPPSQPPQPALQPSSQTIAQQPVLPPQLTSSPVTSQIPSPSRAISARPKPAGADQANSTSSPKDLTDNKDGVRPPLGAVSRIPSPSPAIPAEPKSDTADQAVSTFSPGVLTDNRRGVQTPSKAPSSSRTGYQEAPPVATPSSPPGKLASQPHDSPVAKVTAPSSSTPKTQIVEPQQTDETKGRTLPNSDTEQPSLKSNNANQEASRNYPLGVAQAPQPKVQPSLSETTALASFPPPVETLESKTKQQPENEKITKKEVEHDGDKEMLNVERRKETKLIDIMATPIKNSKSHLELVPTQRTETDILDKQAILTDQKSGQRGEMEEGVKNVVSTSHPRGFHNTTHRETSGKNDDTSDTNLTKTMGTPRVSKQKLEDSSLQPRVQPPLSFITLAGENKGAMMNISSNDMNKEGLVPIFRGYKLNKNHKDDEKANEQESTRESNKRKSEAIEMTGSYINNNVQSINNSILHYSSCSEKNPGVHIMLINNSLAPVDTSKERKLITDPRPQQLNSGTRVRRRCLRSLFMESDSDPDNPKKPQRHGCRYNCKENVNNRDKNAEISTKAKEDGQSNS